MSSSPQRSSSNTEQQLAVTESPSRYHSRYNDRFFNSLTSSPPREPTLKNSPLQPSRLSEHKIFEGEKYSSFEIQNSDRGNWRETSVKDEVEQVEISESPSRANTTYRSSPTTTTTSTNATQSSSVQKKTLPQPRRQVEKSAQKQESTSLQQQPRRTKIPRYMEATTSFHDKTHAKREPTRKDNLLRPRSKGGITKRVGTTKIPRYQSTTHINAVEDIKNEMTAEDNYIPMAARIKLFEKGLGNASNKPAAIVPNKYNPSRSISPSVSQQKPKERVSTSPSVSTTRRRRVDSNEVPSFARQTSASATKKREHPVTTTNNKKPFRFTSSEYTSSTTFHERLTLWKVKDKEAVIENQKNRGIKRKNADSSSSAPNSKNKSD